MSAFVNAMAGGELAIPWAMNRLKWCPPLPRVGPSQPQWCTPSGLRQCPKLDDHCEHCDRFPTSRCRRCGLAICVPCRDAGSECICDFDPDPEAIPWWGDQIISAVDLPLPRNDRRGPPRQSHRDGGARRWAVTSGRARNHRWSFFYGDLAPWEALLQASTVAFSGAAGRVPRSSARPHAAASPRGAAATVLAPG